MMPKIFLDTNILIYAADQAFPDKRRIARELIRTAASDGTPGVISTQVLQEFYVACTRRLGLDPVLARNIMRAFEGLEVVTITTDLIHEAIDCSVLNRLSYWDALIVVSAERARCERVFTEDLNDGQIIRGVRVENPFK